MDRPTTEQIEAELDRIPEPDGPSRWPSMTYEQGVDAALRWVLGHIDERPMED